MVLLPPLQTTPLLALDLYRERIEHSPWSFWGLANATVPINSACNGLVYEYAWQNAQGVGRREIARALVDAQDLLAEWLRYDLAPSYREDVIPWPRLNDAAWDRARTIDQRGQYLSVITPRVRILDIGIQLTTLIGTPAVVYSDSDGDGLNDTFTLSIATAVTDPDEIQVFVGAVNRFDGSDLSQRWRIAPVRVTISAGVATIVGRSWLAVRPVLYETQGAALDPATAGNFQTTMDVARVNIDPDGITVDDSQATLLYEAIPCPWFCVPCSSGSSLVSDPAAVGYAVARCGIRNAQTGTVIPASAVYDSTTLTWVAGGCCWTCQPEPDRVLIRYTAGLPLVNHQMAAHGQELIAMLATALIAGPICACKEANKRIGYLQFDLARSSGAGGEAYGLISGEDLRGPFGTRRGAVLAWKRVSKERSVRGFTY